MCVLSHYSCVRFSAALWTVALQLFCPWDSPGKNTGVDCHSLLQGIFLIQGLNPCLFKSSVQTSGFFTASATWNSKNKIYAAKTFSMPKTENTEIKRRIIYTFCMGFLIGSVIKKLSVI